MNAGALRDKNRVSNSPESGVSPASESPEVGAGNQIQVLYLQRAAGTLNHCTGSSPELVLFACCHRVSCCSPGWP